MGKLNRERCVSCFLLIPSISTELHQAQAYVRCIHESHVLWRHVAELLVIKFQIRCRFALLLTVLTVVVNVCNILQDWRKFLFRHNWTSHRAYKIALLSIPSTVFVLCIGLKSKKGKQGAY